MTIKVDITPEMQRRVSDIAQKSGRSETQVIVDALEHGHSLDWQESFLAKIRHGIAAADRGDFATEAEIDRVRQKYRPS
ncbi:hypothetical protein [Mesorhizobium australicum]|uniref:Predicted transcriptional regulator n=1 Tax=Mesorhizobium australicum TaxID=536018 RepID=A0A1X7NQG3_9HYPH|nr:hypothetical protein [Mesorhizobium australicum]SMH39381.1 Predicted transcriptional regulator [Mesorhizobium australicum]